MSLLLQENSKLYIVLEFCGGGDLGHYIKRYRQVSEAAARYFLRQLAEGLKELRRHNVIHVSSSAFGSQCFLQALLRCIRLQMHIVYDHKHIMCHSICGADSRCSRTAAVCASAGQSAVVHSAYLLQLWLNLDPANRLKEQSTP